MTASRSISLRALRVLSQQRSGPAARRSLHITEVQSAQRANPADKASLYAARSLPDLKLECQRRSLGAAGNKSELIERLSNHDMLQSRAFSIALRRINGSAFTDEPSSSTRHFNTSRASKARGDSSTVDFAYLPSMADMDAPSLRTGPGVPILPDLFTHNIDEQMTQSASAPPMKPQIYTVSGAGVDIPASAMSEVVDNDSVDIDPFTLTEAVGRSRVGEELQRQYGGVGEPGVIRELWSGFLEDVLGPKQPTPAHK